jgi:hypothetical protein
MTVDYAYFSKRNNVHPVVEVAKLPRGLNTAWFTRAGHKDL